MVAVPVVQGEREYTCSSLGALCCHTVVLKGSSAAYGESLRLCNSDFAANAAVFEVALTQLASWPHGAPTACPCLAAGYQAPDVVLDVRHPLDNTDGHRCAALAGPRHIHALDVAG